MFSSSMACNSRSKGFKSNKPGYLYYLRLLAENGVVVYKIGITNRSIRGRFSITERAKISIIKFQLFPVGQDCYDEEQRILRLTEDCRYSGPDILDSGHTEMFTEDILKLDKGEYLNETDC